MLIALAIPSPAFAERAHIDGAAVARALDAAAELVKKCTAYDGAAGQGIVEVRYEPSGGVASVEMLTPKFQKGRTGACVRMLFLRAKVPAFSGRSPSYTHSFTVPGA